MTPADPSRPPRGMLPPRLWIPIGGALAAAVVALAVLLALNVGGGNGEDAGAGECVLGTPGCVLRQSVHWHADVALYIRGERYTFDQERFFSDEEEELSANVHIHAPRHNVVHVHRESTTWNEFFASLGFELTDACLTLPEGERLCSGEGERLSFVLNGVRLDTFASQDITDVDRALISFGAESEAEIMRQYAAVSDEACIVSRLCSDRIPAGGIEEEPCAGGGECN